MDLMEQLQTLSTSHEAAIQQHQAELTAKKVVDSSAELEAELNQEIARLTDYCRTCETQNGQLLRDVGVIKEEKDRLLSELDSKQQQLASLREQQEGLNTSRDTDKEIESLKQELQFLGESLLQAKQALLAEQQAKNSLQTMFDDLKLQTSASKELIIAKSVSPVQAGTNPGAEEGTNFDELSVQESKPTHSTPVHMEAELYDGTKYSDKDVVSDISKLRRDLDDLQTQYSEVSSALSVRQETERLNADSSRPDTQLTLNSSVQSVDNASLSSLSETISTLQRSNDKLQTEKTELNRQLFEQERLCQKLHERLRASEDLSSGVEESYAKQLAAAQSQRDEVLRQLEEACRVNRQVSDLVAEQKALQQEKLAVKDKLKERDSLELEMLKLKTQLDSLTHSHHKMTEVLTSKDQASLELSKRNTVLEAAVQRMEQKLRESEQAFESERKHSKESMDEVRKAKQTRKELEEQLKAEKMTHRHKLTSEIEQTRLASEKNSLAKIRQVRLDIEDQYTAAIEKLRQELAEESRQKQDRLSDINRLKSDHSKQVRLSRRLNF